jgi:hypothetical protein
LSENSFWESILFDFQNPVTRAKDLISFSPYYYLSELRKRTDLLREMSPFIGGTTRLVSVFYHLNSYISQLDDCIVNTETRNILTDYLHHKIIKKDYLSSLKALKKTSKLCQQNGSHELSITYNQILKLIKVSNPEIYNEASNLLTNNESVL